MIAEIWLFSVEKPHLILLLTIIQFSRFLSTLYSDLDGISLTGSSREYPEVAWLGFQIFPWFDF